MNGLTREEAAAQQASIETRMDGKHALLEQKMDTGFTAVRAEMDAGFVAVRAEMAAGFAAVRAQFDHVEQRTDVKFSELRTEMHKNTVELVKWVVGVNIAVAATGITVMAFVLNNAVPAKPEPTTPPPAPAPVIIYLPPVQAGPVTVPPAVRPNP